MNRNRQNHEPREETYATTAHAKLRRDIIAGAYPFGKKLIIKTLCENYDVGLAPMREALNRLANEGLVIQADLKGFYVAPIDRADLEDVLQSRIMLNAVALRDSIAKGDQEWEERVLLTHHRLKRAKYEPPNVDPAWEVAHRAFHSALLSACTAPRVLAYCDQLFDAADRYRFLQRRSGRNYDRGDQHTMIMEATLARDADKAVELLSQHFIDTANICRAELDELNQKES